MQNPSNGQRAGFSMPAFSSPGYGKIADVAANIRNDWRNRALSVGSGDVGKLCRAAAVAPR